MYGLKHQEEKRSMDHFAGLDVSVKETSVCIVQWFDQNGQVGKVLDQLLGRLLSKVGTFGRQARSPAA